MSRMMPGMDLTFKLTKEPIRYVDTSCIRIERSDRVVYSIVIALLFFLTLLLFLAIFLHQFVVPEGGISGGSIIGFGPELEGAIGSNDWIEVRNDFELSTEGEQIFLYCLAASDDPRPLNALSYNGPFQEPGRLTYGFNESALPSNLKDVGHVVLPHMDNYNYAGVTNAEDDVLRVAIEDPASWVGSNEARYSLVLGGDSGTPRRGAYSRWTMFAGTAIGVLAAML